MLQFKEPSGGERSLNGTLKHPHLAGTAALLPLLAAKS